MNNEAKIRANKQKADLALEHLRVKMASAQAKKDADAAEKEQFLVKKRGDFEKRKHCASYFGSNMVSFTFTWKNINLKSLIVIFYVLE